MWWSMPETEPPAGGPAVRRLALAGTIERNQRTVLTSVVLADVQPNPDQPRKHFAPDKLAELADSIKARGLLHRSAGRMDLESRSVDRDLPLFELPVCAEDTPKQLGVSGALQAGKPDDLAGADGKGHFPDQPGFLRGRCPAGLGHRETVDLQPHGTDRGPPHREMPAQLAADHPADQLGFR